MALPLLPGFASELPFTLAGVAVLALGVAVLALDPRQGANRAFAALCLLRGAGNTTDILAFVDLAWAPTLLASLDVYIPVLIAFSTVWFIAVYPRRRAWARRPEALVLLGLAATAAVAAVALFAWARPDEATRALPPGPFALLSALIWTGYAGALLVLAKDVARAEPGRARTSLVLVHAAFGIIIARNLTSALFPTDAAGWTAASVVIIVVVSVLSLVGSAYLLRATAYLRAFLLITATVLATSTVGFTLVEQPWRGVIRGLWYMAFPVLVAYALVRFQLFGIDLRVRWTIRQSTVAAAFIAVFFVVSETATQLFSGRVGTYAGIAGAGALVFALAPLQRAAERLATAATPDARPTGEMSLTEREEAYRALVAHAWQDRVMSADERTMLRRAREALGLSAEDAERVEDQVTRAASS